MGHQFIAEKIFDTFIKTETTTVTEAFGVAGLDRVGFFITMAKTSTAGNLTLTLEGACETGTWVTLSFQDGGGCGDSEIYTATADDVIWLPPGSPAPSLIRVSMATAATTDSGKYYTIEIWLVGDRI